MKILRRWPQEDSGMKELIAIMREIKNALQGGYPAYTDEQEKLLGLAHSLQIAKENAPKNLENLAATNEVSKAQREYDLQLAFMKRSGMI